ncbi:MAG TPA: hypothetical protein PKJ51_02625 [Methanothrix sp.]|nr:hypothetical protein [Methanothrix sp.]
MAVVISEGWKIEATSSNDVVIQVAGIMFPVKRIAYQKRIEVKEEWGTGSHLVYDLTTHNIAFTGSFDIGTWISKGDRHALLKLLEDQGDEGIPNWFNIVITQRLPEPRPSSSSGGPPAEPLGGGENTSPEGGVVATSTIERAVFEKLINCKVTTSGRDYPENNTVMTQYEFKAMYREPL